MDLDKLRTRRTIFKRTKTRPDLPRLGLYIEWLGGTAQRRILDEQNAEHVIDDKVLLSYYKLVNKAESKALLVRHWPAEKEKREQGAVTVRHEHPSEPAKNEPSHKAEAKKPAKPTAKKPAAKPKKAPVKKAPVKKPAKKVAKKKAKKKKGRK